MASSAKKKDQNEDELADLLTAHAAGETIVAEGAADSRMYLVERGTVELVKSLGAAERVVETLGPGDFFGELSVLEEGAAHLVSARAAEDARLLPIDASALDFIVREQPELVMRILHKLASQLRKSDEQALRAGEIAAGVLAADRGELPAAGAVVEAVAGGRAEPAATKSAAKASAEKSAGESDRAKPRTILAARLVHPPSGRRFDIPLEGEALVGRFDPATKKSPDVDLQDVDEKYSLSRRHATLWRDGAEIKVREEPGVANGTCIDGRRLAANKVYRLRRGQQVRFGLVDLVLELDLEKARR